MEKISLGLLVGDVLENKINDLTRALEAYKLVLSFDEGSIAALDALIRIHESRNEWEDLLKALDLKAPLVPEEEVQIRMLMGAILEAKVGDANRAIEAYEAVLDVEPTNEPALEHLKDLYGGMDNWLGLADVYERSLASCTKLLKGFTLASCWRCFMKRRWMTSSGRLIIGCRSSTWTALMRRRLRQRHVC